MNSSVSGDFSRQNALANWILAELENIDWGSIGVAAGAAYF
jgi:hypothetical protein